MMNSEEILEQRLANMEKEEKEEQQIAEEIINEIREMRNKQLH